MKKNYTTVKLHIKNEHPPTRGYSFFLYFALARLKIDTQLKSKIAEVQSLCTIDLS